MSSPGVTVAVCTYNRADLLRQTLESLRQMEYPDGEWTLLVIDNNSADDTGRVTEQFEGTLPLRYVRESTQGLAHARNRAIEECNTDVLVFIDDDVLVDGNWLTELMVPYRQHESAMCVAGSVYPVFPEGIPEWMRRDWSRPHLLTSSLAPIPDGEDPMGANLSFRAAVFSKVGVFRTDLGRRGSSLLCGEDAEIVRRVRNAGLEAWFAPAARLEHQFPRSRMNFGYALRHGYDSARSRVIDVLTAGGDGVAAFLVSRFALSLLRLPLLGICGLLVFPFSPGTGKRFFVRAGRSAGYVSQILAALVVPLRP